MSVVLPGCCVGGDVGTYLYEEDTCRRNRRYIHVRIAEIPRRKTTPFDIILSKENDARWNFFGGTTGYPRMWVMREAECRF